MTEPAGFIGGGQIGYNWQYSPLIVVGLEADFQGALEKDSNGFTNSFSVLVGPPGDLTGSAVTSYQTKIDWFGTVRGRIGYLWGDGAVLTYVTGQPSINGTISWLSAKKPWIVGVHTSSRLSKNSNPKPTSVHPARDRTSIVPRYRIRM